MAIYATLPSICLLHARESYTLRPRDAAKLIAMTPRVLAQIAHRVTA